MPTVISALIFVFTARGESAPAAPRLIKSFLSESGKVADARPGATSLREGDKVYLYYRIGPLNVIRGKGAPYRTRMVVMKGNSTVKDFGWHSANAAGAGQMNMNGTLKWYHSAMWSLSIPTAPNPGNYTAVITHSDLNTMTNITIRYAYTIIGTEKIQRTTTAPPGKTVPVTGRVTLRGKVMTNTPVKAYLVSDLAQRRVVLIAETRTDARGNYSVRLAPDSLYILKAGTDEHLWRKGQGVHGGTIIDLNFPEEAKNADIPLENPR